MAGGHAHTQLKIVMSGHSTEALGGLQIVRVAEGIIITRAA